ncbi:bifunctional DNA primase/polymerase [Streptomyces synnematoformans]|uniref:Bifunctional DNA primase/polymerase n=1 Tax=Streptomyces synnematoformans TaxID=415721 RepID=A0ABN2XA10_9ACTN
MAMTRRRQWVRYTARKVPLTAAGKVASSTDPATWSTYGNARRSTAGAGCGFVLTSGDNLVCLDLDHALDEQGRPLPWARELLGQLPDTYVEISPGGRGLHVWGRGTVGRGRRIRRGEEAVEVYDRGRFMTITRRPYEGASSALADLSEAIASLT